MLGIIGGSGLASFDGLQRHQERCVETPYGQPSAAIQLGEIADQPVAFIARHGKNHHLLPHEVNYRANLWALREVGVVDIIGVAAVGGIGDAMAPSVLCVADQVVDYTYGREHTFFGKGVTPVTHIDFTVPYCEKLRQEIIRAAQAQDIAVEAQGVYGATQGPRFETAAEIRRLQRDGCDLVGMTGMPEASLAREADLCYANISLVVNWAAGLSDESIAMDEINRHLKQGMQRVGQVILGCIQTRQ